jgi:hypothetical protein
MYVYNLGSRFRGPAVSAVPSARKRYRAFTVGICRTLVREGCGVVVVGVCINRQVYFRT